MTAITFTIPDAISIWTILRVLVTAFIAFVCYGVLGIIALSAGNSRSANIGGSITAIVFAVLLWLVWRGGLHV